MWDNGGAPKPHFWAQNGPKFPDFKHNSLEIPLNDGILIDLYKPSGHGELTFRR